MWSVNQREVIMDFIEQIKPISYLKSHTSEIVRGFEIDDNSPIVITQNGEAKMVVMSVRKFQEAQQNEKFLKQQLAFAKLISMGNREIEKAAFVSEEDFLSCMDKE